MNSRSLLIGSEKDHTFRHTVERAREQNLVCDVIDLREFLNKGDICFRRGNRTILFESKEIAWDRYTSIYHRLIFDRDLVGTLTHRKSFKYRELSATLNHISHTNKTTVINRPRSDDPNASKLMQLAALQSVGFDIPASLVTSNANAARSFILEQGACVYKSCSATRSIVSPAPPLRSAKFKNLQYCPVLFQKMISGVDVRVHAIGGLYFSEMIESAQIRAIRLRGNAGVQGSE